MTGKSRDLGQVTKAPLDSKAYKAIELKNGLKAVLVSTCSVNDASSSDPKKVVEDFNEKILGLQRPRKKACVGTRGGKPPAAPFFHEAEDDDDIDANSVGGPPPCKKPRGWTAGAATCCLVVGAGSFHDPVDIPGLAHLVEHLVFLGSRNFPERNALFFRVFEHGGIANACTHSEETVFYFSSRGGGFRECCRVLGDSIGEPAFRAADIWREVEAVDSEYGIKQTCDLTRVYDFLRCLGIPNHPITRFYWGNKDTLSHSKLPSKVREWWEKYYRADYMTVCVQGPYCFDELEDIVVASFEGIPRSCGSPSPREELSTTFGNPYLVSKWSGMYHIAPVGLASQLLLNWCLPKKFWKDCEVKPLEYLRAVLGWTGEGGLVNHLVSNGYVTSFFASCPQGGGIFRNEFCAIFSIHLYLTSKGETELDAVVDAVFGYLALIREKGVDAQVFDDVKRNWATVFHFRDWAELMDNGQDIAVSLQRVSKASDVITSQWLIKKFDAALIRECLDLMRPQHANFILLSNQRTAGCKREAWGCGIRFRKVTISEERYCQLSKILAPESFCFVGGNGGEGGELLLNEVSLSPGCDIVVKGPVFEDPRITVTGFGGRGADGIVGTVVPSSRVYATVHSSSMPGFGIGAMEVWARCAWRSIYGSCQRFRKLYGFDIDVYEDCVGVGVWGPSSGVSELFGVVLAGIFREFENEMLENYKRDICWNYFNDALDVKSLSDELHSYLTRNCASTMFHIRNQLEDVTPEDFARLIANFRRRMFVEVEVHGVLTHENAGKIRDEVLQLKYERLLVWNQRAADRATLLPEGISLLKLQGMHPAYVVSVIVNHYQFSSGKYLYLLYNLMRRRIAHQLRTVEQLGYTVRLVPVVEAGGFGLAITVFAQACKFSTDFVDKRIDRFLETFYHAYLKDGDVFKKASEPYLKGREIDLCDFDKYYSQHLLKGGAHLRKLTIQIVGHDPPEEAACSGGSCVEEDPSKIVQVNYLVKKTQEVDNETRNGITYITDVTEYKRGLELVPVPK